MGERKFDLEAPNLDVPQQVSTDSSSLESNRDCSVCLFFSFDIVNSTEYKVNNYKEWIFVLDRLFVLLKDKVVSKMQAAELWRIVGDEAVFLNIVKEQQDFQSNLSAIYSVLTEMNTDLFDGTVFDNVEDEVLKKNIVQRNTVLQLQATAWVAVVHKSLGTIQPKSDDGILNIFRIFEGNRNNRFFEFWGNDIDIGFRLSEFTRANRLVISVELAYLISAMEKKSSQSHMIIVSYQKLKGVWAGRFYPIIWYFNPKVIVDKMTTKTLSFKESIPYDATVSDSIYNDWYNKTIDGIQKPDLFPDEPNQLIEKIIDDCKLIEKINYINLQVEKSKNDLVLSNYLLELHCPAICFDKKSERIFIVKRGNRKPFPNCWEFGCAKATPKEFLVETIINDYRIEFNLDIDIETKPDRIQVEPLPIAIYTVEKNKNYHKGIILLATVKSMGSTEIRHPEKFSESRWISQSEASVFSEDAVPDFQSNLLEAFEYFKRKYSNKDENNQDG